MTFEPTNQRGRGTAGGFALVVTLVFLSAVTLLAVGMFSLVRIDSAVSRAHYNQFRNDLAVRSLSLPLSAFEHTKSDDFVVLQALDGEGNPVFYTAKQKSSGWEYIPLFSGGQRETTSTLQAPNPQMRSNVTDATGAIDLPGWAGNPQLGWERLRPDPDLFPAGSEFEDVEIQYAYWIEDLGGKLDGDVAGNEEGDSGRHLRSFGSDPKELALFTLFGTGDTYDNLDATTADNAFFDARSRGYFVTLDTATQVDLGADEDDQAIVDNVVFGLPAWEKPERIPNRPGIDSSMVGQDKLALNSLIARAESDPAERDTVITEIAEHIKDALPDFANSRAGGAVAGARGYGSVPTTADEYVYNLAANIVDYADRDLTPSVDPGWQRGFSTAVTGGIQGRGYDPGDVAIPRYRGIDGQPFVVGLTNRLWYNGWSNGPPRPSIQVEVSTWIAIWNPNDRPITGQISARLTEGWTQVKWGFDRPVLPHLNLEANEVEGPNVTVDGSGNRFVTLLPNEYTFVKWPAHTILATEGPGSVAPAQVEMDDRSFLLFEAGFQLFWNGELADRTRRPDGMNRSFDRFVNRGRWEYFGSGIGDSQHVRYPDPRGSLYTAGAAPRGSGRYYRSSSYNDLYHWGGAGVRSRYGDLIDPGAWDDGGHRVRYFNSRPNPSSFPDNEYQPLNRRPPESDAPAHIKHPEDDYPNGYTGPGYYDSLGELGHVFDPAAWRGSGSSWTADHTAGRRTLRIGSTEFPNLDVDGVRASHLLDVFSLTNSRSMKGRLNVNSASREALRALAAGIELVADPGANVNGGSGTIYPPTNSHAADIVADAIIESRPFASLADLNNVTYGGNAFFGEASAWPSSQSPRPTFMDDAGREELFSRILGLTELQSRAFRLHVTARVVDKFSQGSQTIDRIVARKSRVYDLFLHPERDGNNDVTGHRVEVLYARDL